MIDNLDKVHSGKLYFPDDEGTLATQREAQELMYDFNATRPGEVERGLSLVHSMLAECGPDCWIGASVSILPGISIGDGSVIGAGAVVTKDILWRRHGRQSMPRPTGNLRIRQTVLCEGTEDRLEGA